MRLMVRLGTLLIRRLAFAALCALAIAACGSGQKPTPTSTTTAKQPAHNTTTVDIYSSLPDSGAEAAQSHQIETGIRLALNLAHHEVGHFEVKYVQLPCDSLVREHRSTSHTPTSRGTTSSRVRTDSRRCGSGWNANAVVDNAETAAGNPQTVAYIGDLDSGATELSAPILNQAGIVQITPGSGYPGLTSTVTVKPPKGVAITPITQSDEPDKYYPRGFPGNRTLLRLIPNDLVQASAALDVLHKTGCQKFSAWNFAHDTESKSLLAAVIATAALKYKMVDDTPPLPKSTKDYLTYTQALARAGVHCAIMIGHVTHDAVLLTTFVGDQILPGTIVGSVGFCRSSWIRGVPKNVVAKLYCTTPALPVGEYGGSAGFVKLFRSNYHRQPTTYDLYGYAATEMLLRALRDTDGVDDTREAVRTSMVYDNAPNAVADTPGQISAFSFDSYGNFETNDDYGVDAFKRGTPQHVERVSIGGKHLLSSGG
jgi:branched-chain amino acid transport system substrate-binding protein